MKPVTDSACVVITGGPSVGKTTLVHALQERGRQVLEESASQIILEGVEHPDRDRQAFQSAVLRRQIELEQPMLARGGTWYADRGLLDGAAYLQLHLGIIPLQFYELDVSHYKAAFLLEPLPTFEKNGIRPDFEDLQYTQKITPLIEEIYRRRGVPVYLVPALSVEERLAFIENRVENLRVAGSVFKCGKEGATFTFPSRPLALISGDCYEAF